MGKFCGEEKDLTPAPGGIRSRNVDTAPPWNILDATLYCRFVETPGLRSERGRRMTRKWTKIRQLCSIVWILKLLRNTKRDAFELPVLRFSMDPSSTSTMQKPFPLPIGLRGGYVLLFQALALSLSGIRCGAQFSLLRSQQRTQLNKKSFHVGTRVDQPPTILSSKTTRESLKLASMDV